jgi:hypothetical protein
MRLRLRRRVPGIARSCQAFVGKILTVSRSGSFGCSPRLQLFLPRQFHGGEGCLAYLAHSGSLTLTGSWQNGYVVIFLTNISYDFSQFIRLAFRTLRTDEHRSCRVQSSAALKAKVTIRIGIARLGSKILSAAAEC